MMNKKRLAVLAMSAVMTASTVSMPVNAMDFSDGAGVQAAEAFSADADVNEETADAVDAASSELASLDWETDSEGKVTGNYTYTLKNDTKTYNGKGDKVEEAATCTTGGFYYYVTTVAGTEKESPRVDTDEALGHAWGEEYTEVSKQPTCTEEGVLSTYHKCSRCNTVEKLADKDKTIEAKGHVLGDDVSVTYVPVRNTKLDADGKIVLEDPTQDGEYQEVRKGNCSECQTPDVTEITDKTIKAEMTVEGQTVVSEVSNIDDKRVVEGTVVNDDFPKADEIQLKDCTKDAYYIVKVYDTNGNEVNTQKVSVAAHHTLEALNVDCVEYADKADKDAGLLTVKLNADGELVVTNNSCKKDVKYYIVRDCVVNGCDYKEKVEKTAPKSDKHSVDTTLQKKIQGYKDGTTAVDYDQLLADVKDKDAKVVNVTATCDKAGTADVEFYCQVCGEKVSTISGVKVTMDHKYVTKTENKVEATCQKAGSYESVNVCERCGKEKSRTTVTVPRLKHTNETAVAINGQGTPNKDSIKGSDASIQFVGSLVFGPCTVGQEKSNSIGTNYKKGEDVITDGTVDAKIVTNCATCHNNEVVLDNAKAPVSIVVKAVKNETKNVVTGNLTAPGSITLVATYTEGDQKISKEITLPYFSEPMDTTLAYTGLHKDVDGIYRYYVDGDFAEDYAGLVEFDGKEFFVANGVLCKDAHGLNLNAADNKWYFLAYGQVQDYTGLALYDGEWFYITDGKLDESVSGLVDYDGGTFLFVEGRLAKEANGLCLNAVDNKWYFMANGQLQKQYTGVAMYDNEFFYIVNGVLDDDYNGTVEYDGETFKVVNGMLQ